MSTEKLEHIKRNFEQKPDSLIPKGGTLSQLFECLSTGDNISLRCTLVDAFLHTYRIFATTEQVLLAADRKFWDVCYSKVIPGEEKLREISALRLILSRWLRQPHVRDFDSLSGLAELHRFTCIAVSWYRVFQPENAPGTQHPGDWTSRYVGQSLGNSFKTISHLAFSGTDRRSLDGMALKLESLCKHAEYRARTLQSKYASGDPNSHSSRQIYRRYAPQSSPMKSLLPPPDRLRKLSAPPGIRAAVVSGLESLNVAEELTAIDQRLFMDLLLPELLDNVRGRPSPTYTATVNQFNRVVNAVQCSVLRIGPDAPKDGAEYRCTTPRDVNAPFAVAVWSNRGTSTAATQDKGPAAENSMETFCEVEHKRANILAQWIDVAWRLRQLNNLTSLQAVLAALQIGVIRRLRHSWTIVELLHAEHYRRFEALNAFMDISENHEKVREHMKKHLKQLMKIERARRHDDDTMTDQPTQEVGGMIPYLGIFMSDLTFLNSAQPDYLTASPISSDSGGPENMQHPNHTAHSPFGSTISLVSDSQKSPSLYRSERVRPRSRNERQPMYKHSDSVGLSNSGESTYLEVPLASARSRSRSKDNSNQGTGEKIINFAKHVREANTLRDLYLLQYSASFYHLKSDPKFHEWFDQFPQLTEKEAMKYSLLIEPTETLSTVTSLSCIRDRRPSNKSMSDIHTWSFSNLSNLNNTVGGARRARSGSRSHFTGRQRVSVLSNPYFSQSPTNLAPSSIDSLNHSSSEVNSPSSSPPTSLVYSHLYQPSSKKSSPQLLNENASNSCSRLLAGSCGSPHLPESPDVFVRVTIQNPELIESPHGSSSSIRNNSKVESTTTTSNHTYLSTPSDFFRHVAKLGSTPNLAATRKNSNSPNLSDSHSIIEKVLYTDRIADVLVRVLTKFGLPVHNISEYDLIHVREEMPDLVFPVNSHAITALGEVRFNSISTNKLIESPNPQVVDCILVRHISKSSMFVSGLRNQYPLDRTTPPRKFSHNGTLSRIRRTHLAITDMWSPPQKLLS